MSIAFLSTRRDRRLRKAIGDLHQYTKQVEILQREQCKAVHGGNRDMNVLVGRISLVTKQKGKINLHLRLQGSRSAWFRRNEKGQFSLTTDVLIAAVITMSISLSKP
jgi:hypothetical protein